MALPEDLGTEVRQLASVERVVVRRGWRVVLRAINPLSGGIQADMAVLADCGWSSVCTCRFGNLGSRCETRQIKKRA